MSNYLLMLRSELNLGLLTYFFFFFFIGKRSKNSSKTHILDFSPFADKFCLWQKISKATFQPFGIEKSGGKSKIAYFLTITSQLKEVIFPNQLLYSQLSSRCRKISNFYFYHRAAGSPLFFYRR